MGTNETTWDWRTLTPALIAQVNVFLMLLGVYHLSNDQLNAALAIVSTLIGFAGILVSHRKVESQP